ncbi:MAG: magnesium transporter, partial [Verrucomicrobiota bacterium]
PENLSVRELLFLLRSQHGEYRQYPIQYIYVTQKGRTLRGVLRLRDLLLALPQARLQDLMIPDPASLQDAASLREISHFFDTHPFLAAPVIDDNQRLLGVLSRRRIKELRQDDAEEALRKRSGILGGDELRTLPLASRCLRRLSWLGPNILLSVLAASVIARSLHAVEAVTTLAVFLPIVSDMSGCSGNQAVAVTIRELTIGVLKPTEYLRVLAKEWLPGLINGAVLGITLGIIAAIWKENLWLGVVVGSALGLNTLFSVLLGGIVPLLLRRFRVDPALASNPLLTTSTDMVGFFLVLNFASLALSKLT